MTGRPRILFACLLVFSVTVANATPARAQSLADLVSRIDGLQEELQAQRAQIEEQEARIAAQRAEIDRLRTEVVAASGLADLRAAGAPEGAQASAGATAPTGPAPAASSSAAASSTAAATPAGAAPGAPLPDKPVGEAPTLARVEQQVQAVPEGAGVLTRRGSFVFEPSIEYTNTSNNRLVFRGIELIPGIQIGLIEASDADRNTIVERLRRGTA